MQLSHSQSARQQQRQTISPQMRQGLKLLEMDLADLRAELYREMAENPVVDDVEPAVESHVESEVEAYSEAREEADASDWPDDEWEADAAAYSADADTLERRRRFFESRTRPETLEEHLRSQLGAAGLEGEDLALAQTLLGYLDDDGRFTGSLPDLVMVTQASEDKIRDTLRIISTLDPPGCGVATLQDCLVAQLDKIPEPYRDEMRELIVSHLPDVARRDYAKVESALGLSRERLEDDLQMLKTLEPHPGRAFASASADEQFITAEIHAVKGADGRWLAKVDERDLPEINYSKRYLALLSDPQTDAATREYVNGKIAAIEAIRDAIANRYETIRAIAQAIFDVQSDFFTQGPAGLKPLTMQEIADKVGVHHTTVSRTVAGKYTTSPFGVVELRSFFISGFATVDGAAVPRSEVEARLRALVDAEDPAAPLSDERLAELLNAEGFAIKRRTVAKYRTRLEIPGAIDRRCKRIGIVV